MPPRGCVSIRTTRTRTRRASEGLLKFVASVIPRRYCEGRRRAPPHRSFRFSRRSFRSTPMEPVTLIVSSIAAACGPALRDTAQSAVRDAYQAVKALIARKYGSVSLEPLERKPESEAKRTSLAEDLDSAGAGGDGELLAL